MKKNILFSALFLSCLFCFTSCNTANPEKYFDLAVLNTNMLNGFAEDGLARQLEYPSIKMDDKGQQATMLRSEVIHTQLKFIEEDFGKLKALNETTDAKDILQNAIALYEYVLPVYKTEYTQLANMYDGNVPKEKIAAQLEMIHSKYFAGYKALYTKLIGNGKLYADKHAIKVNWNVN